MPRHSKWEEAIWTWACGLLLGYLALVVIVRLVCLDP